MLDLDLTKTIAVYELLEYNCVERREDLWQNLDEDDCNTDT